MPFDLAISEHGDLVMSGSRDLAGISGSDQTGQRVQIRLRLHRGTWFYDEDGTLGSLLYMIPGKAPDTSLQVDARVREALRAMPDIQILSIESQFQSDPNNLVVTVTYDYTAEGDDSGLPLASDAQELTAIVPLFTGR